MNVRTAVVVGGMDMIAQAIELESRPHVVIATPGRIVDHLRSNNGDWNLSRVKFLVSNNYSSPQVVLILLGTWWSRSSADINFRIRAILSLRHSSQRSTDVSFYGDMDYIDKNSCNSNSSPWETNPFYSQNDSSVSIKWRESTNPNRFDLGGRLLKPWINTTF